METISNVCTSENLNYIFQGYWMTIRVAAVSIFFSIIIGTALGIMRNYGSFILRKLAGFYIEMFRNTPNLLWVFVCFIAAPFSTAFGRCVCAFVLFTSAMMAEIVRGGLNSISKGQFEAAASQGFTMVGTLWYIVIPQCFRRIIPTLMSQIITVIKDTSFLAQVAVGEMLFNTKDLMAKMPVNTGHALQFSEVVLLFGIAMFLYFILCFTLSCLARYIQKRNDRATNQRA